MVISCPSKNVINESKKFQDNNKVLGNSKTHNEKNDNENVTIDNINQKQKDTKNNYLPLVNISDETTNIVNKYIKDNKKNNSNKLKNEKINTIDTKIHTISNNINNNENDALKYNKIIRNLNGNIIIQGENNVDKKKISKKLSNTVLKKEKDSINNNDANNNSETNSNIDKLNANTINNNKNGNIKKQNCKNNETDIEKPVLKRRPPLVPTISDKKNERIRNMYSEGRKVRNSIVITKYEDIVKIKNKNDKENNHSEVESITPLSNSHSTLIANTAFKNKKEITNKRIVKAISKYKPSINVPTINKVEEGSFNIYKSAHLDFCRNCLIPKDVLHFQGLLLFKNMSKLKGMNLSRQQINNALEWEVIRYTVFNNKSTDNWSNLLNQYKSDRTSTKILSKRYAARRQGQKSVKKETESFERKYIAYNIIKKKAPTLANFFNSESDL